MCRRGWWALAVLGAWTVVVVAAHLHAANVGCVPWMPKQGGPEYPTPSAVQFRAAAVEAVVRMACLPISFAARLLVAGSSSDTRAELLFLRGGGGTVLALASCTAFIVLGFIGLRKLVFFT